MQVADSRIASRTEMQVLAPITDDVKFVCHVFSLVVELVSGFILLKAVTVIFLKYKRPNT